MSHKLKSHFYFSVFAVKSCMLINQIQSSDLGKFSSVLLVLYNMYNSDPIRKPDFLEPRTLNRRPFQRKANR